ncbi:MAG TPA: sensor histidine kinase [Candidatus Sulfotelmatobacter sp.]|nr:sensor histidine kinase [Candidatus Sulfotelmatobacter sp.]
MDSGSVNNLSASDLDVVILAPFGKDCALIGKVLRNSGVEVRSAGDSGCLVDAVPENAGAAVVAEEALVEDDIGNLGRKLKAQPQWSDFPIIVLTGGGMSTSETEVAVRSRTPLGNVTLLERPLRAATLVSAVRSALSARRRQYEIRDHLRQQEVVEQALRDARDSLESIVRERTAALCRLSAQLLGVQDEERRRIARELHDGLGQYLAAAKITLDTLAFTHTELENPLSDVTQLIDRAITETRTLSHLLHPPLLDAAGFSSAASWYVEGFGKRSGIAATLKLPDKLGRLPTVIETALFRIMQEALTNVHRHSGSGKVEILLNRDAENALLVIRDFGKGIPKETLEQFTQSGTNVGVGLAGIRERVKELGGTLEIHSSSNGTSLKVELPITAEPQSVFSASPFSQIYSSITT